MAIKLIDFFFALANGAFTVETNVEGSSVFELFSCHISVSLLEPQIRGYQGSLKLKVN